jgi:hypothetical protein
MSPELRRKILILYKSGMRLREIGEKIGLSHEAVRREIPKNMIRRSIIDKVKMKKVMSVYNKCGSYQKTADILGMPSRQSAYRVVLKAKTGSCK